MAKINNLTLEAVYTSAAASYSYATLTLSDNLPDASQLQVVLGVQDVVRNSDGALLSVETYFSAQDQQRIRTLPESSYTVDDIGRQVESVMIPEGDPTPVAGYTYPTTLEIDITTPLAIQRSTDVSNAVIEFQPGSRLTSTQLEAQKEQEMNALQELTAQLTELDSGTVGPIGPEGPEGPQGPEGPNGSVDILTDVDTTTTAPNPGEALVWDGSNWIPGIVASSAPVDSVNGETGVVVLDGNDIETTTGGGVSVTTALNTLSSDLDAVENHLIASGMSTGITNGGEVTLNANMVSIDVAAGHGHVLDNFTTPSSPTLTDVTWPAQNIPLTNLATSDITTLYVDINGVIQQSPLPPTNDLFRDAVLLGAVAHPNRTIVTGLAERKVQGANLAPNVHDIFDAVGRLNLSGNVYSAGGANLTIARTAGEILDYGVNYAVDKRNPNVATQPAAQPTTFIYALQDGTVLDFAATDIDPTQWDDNGTLEPLGNKDWSIHHLYVTSTGQSVVFPGQAKYKDVTKAKASVGVDPHVLPSTFASVLIPRATLITKKTTTDLTDIDEAIFSNVSKFGAVSAGGSTVGGIDDLTDVDTSTIAPAVGEVLEWDGVNWVPAVVSGGGGGSASVTLPYIQRSSSGGSSGMNLDSVTVTSRDLVGNTSGGFGEDGDLSGTGADRWVAPSDMRVYVECTVRIENNLATTQANLAITKNDTQLVSDSSYRETDDPSGLDYVVISITHVVDVVAGDYIKIPISCSVGSFNANRWSYSIQQQSFDATLIDHPMTSASATVASPVRVGTRDDGKPIYEATYNWSGGFAAGVTLTIDPNLGNTGSTDRQLERVVGMTARDGTSASIYESESGVGLFGFYVSTNSTTFSLSRSTAGPITTGFGTGSYGSVTYLFTLRDD